MIAEQWWWSTLTESPAGQFPNRCTTTIITDPIAMKKMAMVRHLVPVVALLLQENAPAAMQCARAKLDFVILASYSVHEEAALISLPSRNL